MKIGETYGPGSNVMLPAEEAEELARIALASLTAQPAPERDQVRREHAEWSDKTFGDVGPIGPLKHLSREALETAAEPDDLSEWADMQFLLWDAQRRAGISDAEITAAMEEKLAINKARQWPEPKDGEPRLHIKEQPAPVVPEELSMSSRLPLMSDQLMALGYVKGWSACREAMLQGGEPVSQTYKLNELSGNSPVIPDGWVMVPVDLTPDMRDAYHNAQEEYESLGGLWSPDHQWKAMLAAAPQQEVK
ncbi:DUF550 domain-containing protein [Salmonella enterica]|nr:DUF550 domain-containing protein [Salmonella enterica]